MPIVRVLEANQKTPRLPHAPEYEAGSAFTGGKYCSLLEASVPILDAGFLIADATYEKLTVSKGRFFRLQDHFDRLNRSCEKLRLRNPYTNEQMVEIFNRLLRLSGLREAGVW